MSLKLPILTYNALSFNTNIEYFSCQNKCIYMSTSLVVKLDLLGNGGKCNSL